MAALRTLSRVASLTSGESDRARAAVLLDTPASLATSMMVGRLPMQPPVPFPASIGNVTGSFSASPELPTPTPWRKQVDAKKGVGLCVAADRGLSDPSAATPDGAV